LITVCAIFWDIGVVLQKQGADCLPVIGWGKELPKTILACFQNWKWSGGLVASALGWAIFVYALNYTPVSLARTIQGSGFIILAFFSILFLNHRLKSWEWIGVIIITAGIIALGLSEPPEAKTVSTIIYFRLLILLSGFVGLILLLYSLKKFLKFGFQWVIIFSIGAGTMLGLGDVSTKTLLNAISQHNSLLAFGLIAPFLIICYLTGLMLLSRSYQHGRAILVTAVSDFLSRVVTILFGVFALGESFPASPLLKTLRISGLCAIILGAALMARLSSEQLADKVGAKS